MIRKRVAAALRAVPDVDLEDASDWVGNRIIQPAVLRYWRFRHDLRGIAAALDPEPVDWRRERSFAEVYEEILDAQREAMARAFDSMHERMMVGMLSPESAFAAKVEWPPGTWVPPKPPSVPTVEEVVERSWRDPAPVSMLRVADAREALQRSGLLPKDPPTDERMENPWDA